MLVLQELSGTICSAAIEVHKQLRPGLLESAYEECLCHDVQLMKDGMTRRVW